MRPLAKVCGDCSLCCKLVEVKALAKPAGTWCEHCSERSAGCAIFGSATRPAACVSYQCAWLFNQSWPQELKPNRCHVVFEPFGSLGKISNNGQLFFAACVDPAYPEAWKSGAANDAIQKMMFSKVPVVVVTGHENRFLIPPGRTKQQVLDAVETTLKAYQCPPRATQPA